MAEALDATAARVRSVATTVSGVAGGLRLDADGAGDPAVAAGLTALIGRLAQTAAALVTGHNRLALTVASAAQRYRTTDEHVGRQIGAEATAAPAGVIGQASLTAGATPERWGTAFAPEPRADRP
jgi:hypothetical protein